MQKEDANMQVVRSGLLTQMSGSIGVGSVSMGALRERLNGYGARAKQTFQFSAPFPSQSTYMYR